MGRETTLREDFREQRLAPHADERVLRLLIAASPVPGATGTILDLGTAPVVLERVSRGRADDTRMSRWHATVRMAPGGDAISLTDGASRESGWARSANGTWVRGKSIDEPTKLGVGDRFTTGRTLWMVVAGAQSPGEGCLLQGVSVAMNRARQELELVTSQVALRLERGQRVTQALLVTGQRGTGKQAVAREAARLLSVKRKRKEVPFRQVAAPTLADGTAAADLFGVVDKYATDVKARAGYFEQAQGGVLFLDEVGDTPVAEQAKLLNVLQEREVVPLGGRTAIPFDCLVIAATNRDLTALSGDGSFREDLTDRLARFTVHLPGLSERKEDIPVLVHALLDRHGYEGTVDAEVVDSLIDRAWPGNVRELGILLERMVAIAEVEEITVIGTELLQRATPEGGRLGSGSFEGAGSETSRPGSAPIVGARVGGRPGIPGRAELVAALEATGWNKTEVGHRYGKHPRQVTRWMTYLGIERPDPE